MRRSARWAGGAVATALVLLAGCSANGGGSDPIAAVTTTSTTTVSSTSTTTTTTTVPEPSTTTTAAPTTAAPQSDPSAKANFVERANQICRDGAEGLRGQEPDATDEAAMSAYITGTFVPAVRRQLDDIRSLGFPPGDEAELSSILDDTGAALDQLAADPIGVINSGRDPFGDVNARLNAYGLTDCGAS